MTKSNDFERNLEIGMRLNDKLQKFAEQLEPDEQKGLKVMMKLAEYAVENTSFALFGLENKGNINKLRKKLMDAHCSDEKLSDPTIVTNPTATVTVGIDNPLLFQA